MFYAELCNLQRERMALSPRKLMLVMNHYISNFNLANQQVQFSFSFAFSSIWIAYVLLPYLLLFSAHRMQRKRSFIFCPLYEKKLQVVMFLYICLWRMRLPFLIVGFLLQRGWRSKASMKDGDKVSLGPLMGFLEAF